MKYFNDYTILFSKNQGTIFPIITKKCKFTIKPIAGEPASILSITKHKAFGTLILQMLYVLLFDFSN